MHVEKFLDIEIMKLAAFLHIILIDIMSNTLENKKNKNSYVTVCQITPVKHSEKYYLMSGSISECVIFPLIMIN